jgi:hypothetical protein
VKPSPRAFPLADAPALARAARHTRFIRIVLAGLLALLVAFAFAAARRSEAAPVERAAARDALVVVLDVSGSISSDAYRRIAVVLADISRQRARRSTGLVLFASLAQEALPPAARGAELDRFVPFFLPRASDAATSSFGNPWSSGLGGGTEISLGLRAAREALTRAERPSSRVVLVSDLADSPSDLPALRRVLSAYATDPSLELRVIPLPGASEEDKSFFLRRLGAPAFIVDSAFLAPAQTGSAATTPPRAEPFPGRLVLLVVLVGLALALYELVAVPLRWRPATAEGRR